MISGDLDSETPDFYTPSAVFAGALTLGIDELNLRARGKDLSPGKRIVFQSGVSACAG